MDIELRDGNEMDTYADDLAAVVRALDRREAILVGHSTGGGEVVRYLGSHGSRRAATAVLIGAIPPIMLKTTGNPGGLPLSVFDEIRSNVQADRSQFFRDLSAPFYGANRPTLVLHGDDDQIVPTGTLAHLSVKLVKDATLKVYPGGPHTK